MTWLRKLALTDRQRINSNLDRLQSLLKQVHDLGFFAFASQSGSYQVLENLVNDKLVLGRPKVRHILQSALTGENNQKLVLDSPSQPLESLVLPQRCANTLLPIQTAYRIQTRVK